MNAIIKLSVSEEREYSHFNPILHIRWTRRKNVNKAWGQSSYTTDLQKQIYKGSYCSFTLQDIIF